MPALFKTGSRLEAFSDGVFAIAITLLILEIRVPSAEDAATPAALWHALLARWPSCVAFLVSFWTILTSWIGHHLVFQEVRSVSRTLAWVNGVFLLLVTVIPFTIALVAEHLPHPSGRVAALIYAVLNGLNCVTYLLLARVSRSPSPDSGELVRYATANSLIGLGLCGLAIVLAVISPLWSLLLVGLTWLSWSVGGHHARPA